MTHTWNKISKATGPSVISGVSGTPIGLLLALTYATTTTVIIEGWTKITDVVASPGLWAASVLPWQLTTPWQTAAQPYTKIAKSTISLGLWNSGVFPWTLTTPWVTPAPTWTILPKAT